MTPAGRPISHAFEVPLGLLSGEIRDVLRALDAVHGNGPLPRLTLAWAAGTGRNGYYLIDRPTGEPVRIVIDVAAQFRRLAVLHEIGHFLDHRGIGSSRTLASSHSRLLHSWRTNVRESWAVRQMEERWRAAGDRTADRAVADASSSERRYIRYLLTYHELWARCYAQFVATQSGDAALLQELTEYQMLGRDQLGGLRQWDDDDFSVISHEMERVFRRLAWLE